MRQKKRKVPRKKRAHFFEWLELQFGTYNDALAACELDARFVLDETTSPELIAATIVQKLLI